MMGSILQFFDFNQANASRNKVWANSRHNNGFEAPRNSFEAPTEQSHSFRLTYDKDIPVPFKTPSFPKEAPFTTSIDEGMTQRTRSRNTGSNVVARLMGMDSLPLEFERNNISNIEKSRKQVSSQDDASLSPTHCNFHSSSTFGKSKQDLLPFGLALNANLRAKELHKSRRKSRLHPQEEELQKFKKEFEAWQTVKKNVLDSSNKMEIYKKLGNAKATQVLGGDNLYEDKITGYGERTRGFLDDKYFSQEAHSGKKNSKSYGEETKNKVRNDDVQLERLFPSKIVILRPSSYENFNIERKWCGSLDTVGKEGNVSDFLEEVKEKLKLEIEGKARSSSKTKHDISEACFSGYSGKLKHVKQIREKAVEDFRPSLMRSESTRSNRREVQLNESESEQSVNKNTRKILSERLKNVLKDELDRKQAPSSPTIDANQSKLTFDKKVSHKENKRAQGVLRSRARSFGQDQEIGTSFEDIDFSPRNLIRSYSVPEKGKVFGKLLLEDNHLSTGAHIMRKQEGSSDHGFLLESRKIKKEGLSHLKDTVSNLRNNLGFKRKLFGKKVIQCEEEKHVATKLDPLMAFVTAPSVVLNRRVIQDNFTEVPPSPASNYNSSPDEYYHPSNPSPVSPLEVLYIESDCSAGAFGGSSSDNPDLRCSSTQSKINHFEEVEELHQQSTSFRESKIENPEKSYLREIISSASIFFDQDFLMWESSTKPTIPNWVFEEVEESFGKNNHIFSSSSSANLLKSDQKVLFDLVNEVLPILDLRGNQEDLVDELWARIEKCRQLGYGDKSDSIEWMIELDMKTTSSWGRRSSSEDAEVAAREAEVVIVGELLQELVCELCI